MKNNKKLPKILKKEIKVSSQITDGFGHRSLPVVLSIFHMDREYEKEVCRSGMNEIIRNTTDKIHAIVTVEAGTSTSDGDFATLIAIKPPKKSVTLEKIKKLGKFAERINKMLIKFAYKGFNETELEDAQLMYKELYEE